MKYENTKSLTDLIDKIVLSESEELAKSIQNYKKQYEQQIEYRREDRSIIHTCTPCREYMLEVIQKEILAGVIVRYRYDDDKDGKVFEFIMIGDVIAYIEETGLYLDEYYNDALDEIIRKRKEKRKPLSEQSDECIRYIYSLLPPEVRK